MKKSQIKILFLVLMFAALTLPLFAQDIVPPGMNNLMKSIVDVMKGPLVTSIMIICLCGCAIAYGFNKDNEKMKRNVIAIAIAIAIIVGASQIVGVIWSAAS